MIWKALDVLFNVVLINWWIFEQFQSYLRKYVKICCKIAKTRPKTAFLTKKN